MGIEVNLNAMNVFPKGTLILRERETVQAVFVVVKGHVGAQNQGHKMILSSGNFFGITDLFFGSGLYTYTALDDVSAFAFRVNDIPSIKVIPEASKEYRGLVINSMLRHMVDLARLKNELANQAENLYSEVTEDYVQYLEVCKNERQEALENKQIKELTEPDGGDMESEDLIQYFIDCAAVPIETQKAYYGVGTGIVMYEIPEIARVTLELTDSITNQIESMKQAIQCVAAGDKDLLFALFALEKQVPKGGHSYRQIRELIDQLMDAITTTKELLEKKTCSRLLLNDAAIHKAYVQMVGDDEEVSEEDQPMTAKEVRDLLRGSLRRITQFSGAPTDICAAFEEAVGNFVTVKDRISSDDNVRAVRGQISKTFYEIYEGAFFRAMTEQHLPKEVELFLNFGFADERLLTDEQLLDLMKAKTVTDESLACNIYTLFEWLREIYEGRKSPSKNEFDLEFTEYLRELRKNGKITEEQMKLQAADRKLRVKFEIANMFRSNSRIVNGQISIFAPILFSEQISGSLYKHFVKKDVIDSVVLNVRELDFSVFHRQILFYDKELGIEKEYEMKEVFPDIILMPVYGQNASMWQEISEKHRDSAARFMFPIFVESRLSDLVIRTLGRFRWDLCRTMQGTSWNNIQEKSLTSEYYDYLQYYKRNKDLGDERKEKIKQQLVKAKNNKREVFAMDYEMWIKNESVGAMRLSRVTREILATYCPFNKEKREELSVQTPYAEAMARYQRETLKRIKDIELHHRAIVKNEIDIPKELLYTLEFYKNN